MSRFQTLLSNSTPLHLGRELAFKIGFLFWIPCGVLCMACGWSMPGDEAAVRREMTAAAAARGGGGGGAWGRRDAMYEALLGDDAKVV